MKKILAVLLAIQVSLPVCVVAQQPQQPQQNPLPPAMIPNSLKILVLEGRFATNRIEDRQATPPVIEVHDENDKPIEGATVVFRLPPTGPGGVFPGEALSRTFRTNSQGQAMATGFLPNAVAGPFRIHVTATVANKIGELDIDQTNSTRSFVAHAPQTKHRFSKKWVIITAAAVGGAVAIILLTTRNSSPPPTPTVTITPGPVTIGGR